MIYAIVCIALIKLRKKRADQTGYFKVRYGKAVAIVGLLITFWLLSSSKINEMEKFQSKIDEVLNSFKIL